MRIIDVGCIYLSGQCSEMYHKCFISAAVLGRGFQGHENCGGFFSTFFFFFSNVLTVSKKKKIERERERDELTDTRLSCVSVGVGERRFELREHNHEMILLPCLQHL